MKSIQHQCKQSIRLSLCAIQEVKVTQLRDAAAPFLADPLYTRGHLIHQTWWRLSPPQPQGAAAPLVAAAVGGAGTRTCGAHRPTATLTRRGWRPSKRPATTSAMRPMGPPTLRQSPLRCPGQQGGAGSTDQMSTASRTCSCRCSLLVMRRMERKRLVIHLTGSIFFHFHWNLQNLSVSFKPMFQMKDYQIWKSVIGCIFIMIMMITQWLGKRLQRVIIW